jgi:hypothetical protein
MELFILIAGQNVVNINTVRTKCLLETRKESDW